MKREMLYLIALAFFFTARSKAQTWNLVWSDEFNGSSIDSSNWTFDTGGGGWGNKELECYTSRSVNARVQNGNLLIIARHESYGGSDYTSARLKTQGLRSFMYGKIVASIKLPAGQGLWPAFWMLGNDITQVGWPECGEVDIMEHIDNVPRINGTMHWYNNGNASYGGTVQCDSVTKYNTYSVEWNPDSVVWFLDGKEYWAGDIANGVNSTGEFHQPFFVLLNMAVGGDWPGSPDSTTVFPDTMFVDYVRVYQLAAGVHRSGSAPGGFRLVQNYPNPFNPATTICYQLAAVSHVTLKVYDVLGREVRTLVNGVETPGSYETRFNARDLPSGVYFYRLSADGLSRVGKLLLLK